MRLWHKDLIPVLPRKQLLSQWRECCAIAKNIAINGTPNHILVNRVLDYPLKHLCSYAGRVSAEMIHRGYRTNYLTFMKHVDDPEALMYFSNPELVPIDDLFSGWHNERYFLQCFCNLQEKYDCGGITEDEWQLINAPGIEEQSLSIPENEKILIREKMVGHPLDDYLII